MVFVFISECEKKSHDKTRMVLDSFVDRVGSYSWIGCLTSEGVDTVRKELAKNSSTNTAVSCFKISKNKYILQWIVGSKKKFNTIGLVPINYTEIEMPLIEEGE